MIDTIVAQATPPGRGGVGIIRVSGPLAQPISKQILKKNIQPRTANYLSFFDTEGNLIDQGIAIFFKSPNSFTGEDVLELQGHGGPIIMDMLLEAILNINGTRIAKPGEFSEQAFLNDKLDLAQAEAIADIIDAGSRSAAKSALRSLQGEFSSKVKDLSELIILLRMYVEAAIDFPDEEIDFLSDGKVLDDLTSIQTKMSTLLKTAKQGSILREGLQIVIAGKPNAGKSSLLNTLSGKESAIVTHIAGTTRDVLKEYISINDIPLHVIDTAGLRDSQDEVEKIGIKKAWEAISQADRVLFVIDSEQMSESDPYVIWPEFMAKLPSDIPISIIRNKIDKTNEQAGETTVSTSHGEFQVVRISVSNNEGIDELKQHLVQSVGVEQINDGQFIARRRHLNALEQAQSHLTTGFDHLQNALAGELLAEELRLAHQDLCEITGEFTSDDLLSKIFSSFCIGK